MSEILEKKAQNKKINQVNFVLRYIFSFSHFNFFLNQLCKYYKTIKDKTVECVEHPQLAEITKYTNKYSFSKINTCFETKTNPKKQMFLHTQEDFWKGQSAKN